MSSSPRPSPAAVARDLFESARLRGTELETHLERAVSPDYWRTLAPTLSVAAADSRGPIAIEPPEPARRDEIVRRFGSEGYLKLERAVPTSAAAAMLAGVQAVDRAGWPPVFAWVYDELWQIARHPALVDLFSAILGPGYRQTPYLWTHIVARARGESGWAPHVDNNGDTLRLTVWVALSNATTDEGCMHVVPLDRVLPSSSGDWFEKPALAMGDVLALLQASRALPVLQGSILAWNARVVHWGSARQEAGDPRVSMSMELVGADAPPSVLSDTLAAGRADRLPSFEERLWVIANAIAEYHAIDCRAARHVTLAERLLERLRPKPPA